MRLNDLLISVLFGRRPHHPHTPTLIPYFAPCSSSFFLWCHWLGPSCILSSMANCVSRIGWAVHSFFIFLFSSIPLFYSLVVAVVYWKSQSNEMDKRSRQIRSPVSNRLAVAVGCDVCGVLVHHTASAYIISHLFQEHLIYCGSSMVEKQPEQVFFPPPMSFDDDTGLGASFLFSSPSPYVPCIWRSFTLVFSYRGNRRITFFSLSMPTKDEKMYQIESDREKTI